MEPPQDILYIIWQIDRETARLLDEAEAAHRQTIARIHRDGEKERKMVLRPWVERMNNEVIAPTMVKYPLIHHPNDEQPRKGPLPK